MRLLIFGPQGVGKGTQAALLAPHWGIPHISTGDLFRANIAADTFLGRQARTALESGELVPDGITQGMLADRLNEAMPHRASCWTDSPAIRSRPSGWRA